MSRQIVKSSNRGTAFPGGVTPHAGRGGRVGSGRKCRTCGCTNTTPCRDKTGKPCWWIAPDLCSACALPAPVPPPKVPPVPSPAVPSRRPHRTLARRIAKMLFTAPNQTKVHRLIQAKKEDGWIDFEWTESLAADHIRLILERELPQ